jgi:hypothetical protein
VRVAFDLDGVLADLHTPFQGAVATLYPELDAAAIGASDIGQAPADGDGSAEEPSDVPADASTAVALSRAQSDAVWRHVAGVENFWETLDEIEHGAIRRLADVADARGWEVLFITSRPTSAGRTVQRQSQRWLADKGFPLPSVYVVHGSRGQVAQALRLDAVIDDRADNCLDVVLESRAGAILVWRDGRSAVPASARRLGIAVAPSVAVTLDRLIEAEEAQDGGGLLDRLRRLFGLRTKTSPFSR